jgi:replicative DNA helicase
MQQEKGENRATAVQRFAYGLADIGRDFNVAMIIASQLSNEAEKAETLHLGLLKESGGVAEAADCIIIIDNINRRKREALKPGEKCKIDLLVDAQRDGVSGWPVHTVADLRYGRFHEITKDEQRNGVDHGNQ